MSSSAASDVYKRQVYAGAINELCWGLEEQGVPCQTITYDGGGDAAALGALAARSSPLRVGIGLSASGEIALTHAPVSYTHL
ncbi:hypothetical protein OQ616_25585, partial [Escherichia coli]|uniref:glycerol dehydratase reactivase beta/small subunit family protein n=1 Tax=Escherichia coli TaxID=562 RepID=UPI002B1CC9EA